MMKHATRSKKASLSGLWPGREPTVQESAAPRGALREVFWQALIVLLGTAGCLGCLISSFRLSFSPAALLVALPLMSVLFTLVFRGRLYGLYALLFFLGAGILVFLAFPLFQNAFLVTLAQALKTLNSHLNWYLSTYACTCPPSQHEMVSTVLLLLVGYVLSMLLGWAAVQHKNLPLTILFMLPFITPGLYFTLTPGIVFTILVVLCWMGVFSMQMEKHGRALFAGARSFTVKAGATVLAVTLLCIGGLSVFIPQAGFRQPPLFDSVRSAMLEGNFGDLLNPNTVAGAGLSEGKIDGADVIQLTGQTAMTLTTNCERPFYLRGWVGGAYNGRGWDPPSDSLLSGFSGRLDQLMQNGFREQTQISSYLKNAVYPHNGTGKSYTQMGDSLFWKDEFPSYSVGVSLINANSVYAYVPTGLDSAQGNFSYDANGIVYPSPWGNREYSMDTVTPLNEDFLYDCNSMGIADMTVQLTEQQEGALYRENEARYRSLVHEAYTALPGEVRENSLLYLQACDPNFAYGSPPESGAPAELIRRIELVRYCLSRSGRYTLSPGATPADRDFVNYFLTENHKGYCVHFATSGVVLLRSMGIPARYAEGYVVTWDDLNEVRETGSANITDANAHAWVEVYLDGFGWLPVEFTPGYADLQSTPHQEGEPLDNPPEVSSKPEDASSSSISLAVSEPEQDDSSPSTPLPGGSSTSVPPKATQSSPLPPGAWAGIIGGGVLLLAALALCLRRRSAVLKRGEAISDPSPNNGVLACYRYLQRLTAFDGQPDKGYSPLDYARELDGYYDLADDGGFLRAARLMEQAEFSRHPVPEEERRWMAGFARSFARRVYGASPVWKKLIFKYIHNLL